MLNTKRVACATLITMLFSNIALAASDKDIDALRAEIQQMKQAYETRIDMLESKLNKMEKTQAKAVSSAPATPATARRDVKNNSFNINIC